MPRCENVLCLASSQPRVSCIITSPFQRAIETATILKLYTDLPLIIDYGYGEFVNSDKINNIPILRFNNTYYYSQNLIDYHYLFNKLKLESFNDVFNRTNYSFYNSLKYCNNPIIFTHRSTINILLDSLNIIMNINIETTPDYGAITSGIYTKNNYNDSIKLLSYNNISHLKIYIKAPIHNPNYGKIINNNPNIIY